jgi:hypothetical protein
VPGTIIELDDRRRASLGRIGRPEHKRYLVEEQDNGTLILTPAVVLTETEYELLRNPALVASLQEAISDPSKRSRRGGRPVRKD